jgi:hypothetical protein
MSWIAAAVAGGSILNAGIGAAAAGSAAGSEVAAGKNAIGTLQGMYGDTQTSMQPFIGAGQSATGQLSSLLQPGGQLTKSFSPQDYLANQDPSYGMMKDIGLQTLNSQAGAGSGALSGAAMKNLAGWAENYASTGYQSAYDRWMQQQNATYSRLMGMSQLGQGSALGLGQIGANYGRSIADVQTGIGSAQAAGTIGQANAISGGINNMTGYLTMGQLLNQNRGGGGAGTGGTVNFDPSSWNPTAPTQVAGW